MITQFKFKEQMYWLKISELEKEVKILKGDDEDSKLFKI